MGNVLGVAQDSDLYPAFSENPNIPLEGDCIYVDGSKYYYITVDRGKVTQSYESEIQEDVLYPVFDSITACLARNYELTLRHKNPNADTRRIWFPKQLELLQKINEVYTEKRKAEQEEALKISPYRE
jgi:hypothetical protein